MNISLYQQDICWLDPDANYKKIDPTGKLADVFSTYQLKEKITKSTSDAEVVSIIKSEMESALSNSFNVLRNRDFS